MKVNKNRFIAVIAVLNLMAFSAAGTIGQETRQYIQANAQGTGSQLGRMVVVNVIINEFSTGTDQKALIDAFKESGSEGVANALGKMHAKGRISLPGTLGYDINYIREIKMPDGTRKIRLVTDRPITFGERWASTRSQDYNLSAAEFVISSKKGDSVGTLLPACRFKIDKQNELQIEALENPWKLLNVESR